GTRRAPPRRTRSRRGSRRPRTGRSARARRPWTRPRAARPPSRDRASRSRRRSPCTRAVASSAGRSPEPLLERLPLPLHLGGQPVAELREELADALDLFLPVV